MATANPLEDEVSCSVCFEIYQDPHVLPVCLHTFCLKCITKLQQQGRVQCPECRQFTNSKDAKKDFKTQRLIDLQQSQQNQESQPSTQSCGMCDEPKTIKSHCVQCKLFLCSGCETGHTKSKALKSHTVKSVEAIVRQFETECYKTISDLNKEEKNIDKELNNISNNIADIQQSNTRQLADVKTFTQDRIQAMRDQEKTLEKVINDANDNLLKPLKERREILSMQKTDIQSKIDLLEDLIKSQDVVTLQETAKSANQTIKNEISKIQSILSQRSRYMTSNVIVKKRSNWDVDGSIEVKVMMYANQQIQPVLKSIYSELYTHQYQCNKQMMLDFWPHKLCIINNQLWCAGNGGGLRVFDKNSKLVKQVEHKISDVESLTVSDSGHIIVACSSNKGLHQMDTSGKYHRLITKGRFSDVVCYNGDIYALEYEQCKIFVLRQKDNSGKWSKVTEYNLQFSNGDSMDRLCVHTSGIHVSTSLNDCIHVYTSHGQFIRQIGKCGNNTPGEFCRPLVIDVDSAGNVLVADWGNHRFQVYDSRGDWHVITLPGTMRCPIHAVLGDNGELWMIQHGLRALTKYTVQ